MTSSKKKRNNFGSTVYLVDMDKKRKEMYYERLRQCRDNLPKNQYIKENLWAPLEDDNFGCYKKDLEIQTVGKVIFPYNGKTR